MAKEITAEEFEKRLANLLQESIYDRLSRISMIDNEGLAANAKLTKTEQEKKVGRTFTFVPDNNKWEKDLFIKMAGVHLLAKPFAKPPQELLNISNELYESYSKLFDAELDRRKFEAQQKKRESERAEDGKPGVVRKIRYALEDFVVAIKKWWVAAEKVKAKGEHNLREDLVKAIGGIKAANVAKQVEKFDMTQNSLVHSKLKKRRLAKPKPPLPRKIPKPAEHYALKIQHKDGSEETVIHGGSSRAPKPKSLPAGALSQGVQAVRKAVKKSSSDASEKPNALTAEQRRRLRIPPPPKPFVQR